MVSAEQEILVEKAVSLSKSFIEVYAEQSVISGEDKTNNFLDTISEIRSDIENLFPELEEFIEITASLVYSLSDKKSLIMLRENSLPFYSIIKKLYNTSTTGSLINCFTKVMKTYKVYMDDYKEIMFDLDNKIKGNSELENLMKESAKF